MLQNIPFYILRYALLAGYHLFPNAILLRLTNTTLKQLSPTAASLFQHFLEGSGRTIFLPTSWLIREIPSLEWRIFKELRKPEIFKNTHGSFVFNQNEHDKLRNRLAYGKLEINWRATSDGYIVNFYKNYCFSPKQARCSQALHLLAKRLQSSIGAKPYRLLGEEYFIANTDIHHLKATQDKNYATPNSTLRLL